MGRSAAGRRGAAALVAAVLAVPLAAGVAMQPAGAVGAAVTTAVTTPVTTRAPAPAGTLVHRVRWQGRTLTLRLDRVEVRGPEFEVLLQGADGRLRPRRVGPSRTYVGSVDGDPFATASAVVRRDGTVAGAIAQDRGVDLRFEGRKVLTDLDYDLDPYDRGIRWPKSDQTERLATVAPGGATGTYTFDLGLDLDASYFVDHLGSSVPRAVDEIDQAMVHLYATYSRDAMLRPVTGRVVLRGSAARSPYAEARRVAEESGSWDSQGMTLDAAQADWNPIREDGGWDDVMVLQSYMGGGVAYLGGLGRDGSFGSSGIVTGSMTRDWNVVRHELGHNLGVDDYHTDAPEDETIMSGNHFARFDGTELRSMWQLRDERLNEGGVLDTVGTTTAPLPPYAALDLLDSQRPDAAVRLRPVANDHDANGDAVRLLSVEPASHLGGRVSMKRGVVTYVPPAVTEDATADWFRYVVADASGQQATGVVVARVSPSELGPPESWERVNPSAVAGWRLTNLSSGLRAGAPAEPRTGAPVQRAGNDAGTRWRFVASGTDLQVINAATKQCLQPTAGGRLEQAACADPASSEAAAQRWVPRTHPYGGTAVVSPSGTCLTVGGSLDEGTGLRHGRCSGAAALRWELSPVVGPGTYRIVSAGSDRALSMPVDISDGSDLVARTGTDAATSWTFTRGQGGLVLRNQAHTDRCAYVSGPWPRASDIPYGTSCADVAGYEGDSFTVAGADDGTLLLVDEWDRCVSVDDDSDGSVVRFDWCDGSPDQRWVLTR